MRQRGGTIERETGTFSNKRTRARFSPGLYHNATPASRSRLCRRRAGTSLEQTAPESLTRSRSYPFTRYIAHYTESNLDRVHFLISIRSRGGPFSKRRASERSPYVNPATDPNVEDSGDIASDAIAS